MDAHVVERTASDEARAPLLFGAYLGSLIGCVISVARGRFVNVRTACCERGGYDAIHCASVRLVGVWLVHRFSYDAKAGSRLHLVVLFHEGPGCAVRGKEKDGPMANARTSIGFEVSIFKFLYKPLVRRSARHILQGRLLDPDEPERGRWLRKDVNRMLHATWVRVDELLPDADLRTIPTLGNRNNVFLAVVTTAGYQALLECGMPRARAADLIADVGWKIYALGISAASFLPRVSTRDTGKRMDRTLQAMMRSVFRAPGRPGYEVEVVKEKGRLVTHWTWCPPQVFVRNLIDRRGDNGELEAFYRSWCLYDWPGADMMADDGMHGHYERTLTQSKGDAVCDMCWKHDACEASPISRPGTKAPRTAEK